MEQISRWLKRTEEFLDDWGRGAWIAAVVLGFILFWPLGFMVLGYALWSGRMGCWKNRRRHSNGYTRRSSGNMAFDEYRAETLRRLEEEQTEFESLLERLRRAKDKAEFDDFMNERRQPNQGGAPQTA